MKFIFATVLVLLSIRMLLPVPEGEPKTTVSKRLVALGAAVIGTISGLVGIGGGALTVPFTTDEIAGKAGDSDILVG